MGTILTWQQTTQSQDLKSLGVALMLISSYHTRNDSSIYHGRLH